MALTLATLKVKKEDEVKAFLLECRTIKMDATSMRPRDYGLGAGDLGPMQVEASRRLRKWTSGHPKGLIGDSGPVQSKASRRLRKWTSGHLKGLTGDFGPNPGDFGPD
uniref:Uncharacterized protein n=1 Tax=Oryza punctata TaxID=4537 RepID=A0A0E0LT84_ORYPU